MKLFSINGVIGNDVCRKSAFLQLSDMIAHMDYLQVERSVVWQREALDFNPCIGNHKLLESLSRTPDIAKRIVPALVITPENLWQNGEEEQIINALESDITKAFRIFPQSHGFLPEYLDDTLKLIEKYKPVLFCDIEEIAESNIIGMRSLAHKFPKISIVLTCVQWGFQRHAYYLMSACENIYLDTSRLHVNDGIEKIVKRFVANRILFGLGSNTDNGAAIAALAHAQIDSKAMELISHDNAERLLQLQPSARKPCFGNSGLNKPLWEQFSQGNPLDEIEIIDAHGHAGPAPSGWYAHPCDMTESLSDICRKLDRCGVDQIIVSSLVSCFADPLQGNREFADMIRGQYDDKIKGYFVFNPYYAAKLGPVLDDSFSEDIFVGFKLLSDYWQVPVTDKAYESVWQYANEHRLIILIHTWNTQYDSPAMLTDIVKHYPEAFFLLAHSGGESPGRYEAIELAKKNPNVYLEFCGSFASDVPWEWTIQEVGIDQVIFGSDAALHDQAWELGRFLSIPLDDEILQPALASNFKRIVSLRR